MFNVFPLFAAALRPVFVNGVYPRGQISVRLFYIQSIPILPILIYIWPIGGVWGGRGGHCPPRSEPIDFVRSMNTKIFLHCLILFALSYFNEYVKAKLFVINVKKKLKNPTLTTRESQSIA